LTVPADLQAAAAPEPGQYVGSYRVQGLLGEGGMARVYKAVGPDGEEVAVKLVKAELAAEPVFRRRFDREAGIATRVTDPHVVRVLDAGRHHGVPYMAQELMTGGSLQEKLARDGPLELDAVVDHCVQIASGLEAVHAAGLIHRDLKPANVLLDDQDVAKITDFGLVKDLDGTVLTVPGQALGSMDYMAPEQIRGADITPAADVYALGCLMCELLTGKPLFSELQGMKILWAHLQEEPPDPCAAREDVPAALGQAIRAALAKDPEQRPANAMAFAEMVREAAGPR
jgi:serine/threonine-protein kinase